MIDGVIELGERRVHEVMVPRVDMVTLPAGRDARGARSTSIVERGPQPNPGLRGHDRQDRRHPLRQGPAAVPQSGGDRAPSLREPPAAAGVRARVDDRRRPAPRAPAPQGPHRDRARRVRRDGRPGDDRGPDRGDRRRDPGRVRRRGADDRPALRRRGPGRRRAAGRRPRWSTSSRPRRSRTGGVRHGRRARSTTTSAACRAPATGSLSMGSS